MPPKTFPGSPAVGAWLTGALATLLLLGGCVDGTPAAAWPGEGVPPLPTCRGDNDGVIAAGELDFTPGRRAPYALVASPGPPVAGLPEAGGLRLWDFRDATFDSVHEVPLLDPAGLWCADRLAGGTVALPFGPDEAPPDEREAVPSLLVLAATGMAVDILGVASVQPELLLLAYDRAVPFLRFPLVRGARWQAEVAPAPGSRLGSLDLAELALVDAYRVELAGQGRLTLPGMSLDNVLQLDLRLTRRLGDEGATWESRQTYLVHECLGTVALRSEADEVWWVIWYPQ